jgi:hypothetical protein
MRCCAIKEFSYNLLDTKCCQEKKYGRAWFREAMPEVLSLAVH